MVKKVRHGNCVVNRYRLIYENQTPKRHGINLVSHAIDLITKIRRENVMESTYLSIYREDHVNGGIEYLPRKS